jgi:hypothetical protein
MPIFDLRCDGDGAHIVQNEFRHRAPDDLDFGPCAEPGCTGHLRTYWGTPDRERKYDAFTPIEMDGIKYDTRSGWEKRLGQIQRAHPETYIEVTGANRAQTRALQDDIRHDLYRDNGIRNEREFSAAVEASKRSRARIISQNSRRS